MNNLTQILLTDKQLAQYRDEGFVMLGRIMDDDELSALCSEETRIRSYPFVMADGKIEPDGQTVFRNQLSNYSEPVRAFSTGGRHIGMITQLIGPNVCLWFNQFVTKLADNVQSQTGKMAVFPWHQDNGYGGIEPATNITIWCALDDVDETNGCVWVMPGSHKNGVLPHARYKDSWHMDVEVEGDGVPAVLKAGEAIAFSGLTLHRSLANRTPRPRRAFFMEYADAAATQGPDNAPVVAHPNSWLVAGRLDWPKPKG